MRPSNSVPVPEIGEKDDEPNERANGGGRHNEVDWGDKGLETRIHLPSIPQGTAGREREDHIIMDASQAFIREP